MGVPKRIFENETEPPKLEIYEELEKNRHARIVRNLCMLRTAIEQNFKKINDGMRFECKSILSLPEYVPQEALTQLAEDGVQIWHNNYRLSQYILDLNRYISERVNNCRDLFPMWINWQYLRDLFIMPKGLTEAGVKTAIAQYYQNMPYYPYQVYMNWPARNEGNVLFNDRKFVPLLYRWHNDRFNDLSKVSDVPEETKGNIYDFLEKSEKTVVVVDCENSDPYKLCATMRNLNRDMTARISRIILYDDIHSASAWRMLESFVSVPVEHQMVQRVKGNKSLVDIRLTAGACREFYQNHVDSFIVVSSDSDYWGLISSLPEARFLVMVEHEKCGPDIKAAMIASGIFYCYIDDFYSGNSDELKTIALMREMRKYLEEHVRLNVNDMMEEALLATRIEMSDGERKRFYDKFIKPMHLLIGEDGNVTVELREK